MQNQIDKALHSWERALQQARKMDLDDAVSMIQTSIDTLSNGTNVIRAATRVQFNDAEKNEIEYEQRNENLRTEDDPAEDEESGMSDYETGDAVANAT